MCIRDREGSLADRAGLTRGDIIIDIDGEEITNASQIRTILFKHKEGDLLKVKINQNNMEKLIEIKLEY